MFSTFCVLKTDCVDVSYGNGVCANDTHKGEREREREMIPTKSRTRDEIPQKAKSELQ